MFKRAYQICNIASKLFFHIECWRSHIWSHINRTLSVIRLYSKASVKWKGKIDCTLKISLPLNNAMILRWKEIFSKLNGFGQLFSDSNLYLSPKVSTTLEKSETETSWFLCWNWPINSSFVFQFHFLLIIDYIVCISFQLHCKINLTKV